MKKRAASSLDLFTDSLRLMGDATLCSVMRFRTQLEISRMQDSADLLFSAFPILRARLVRGNGPAFWCLEDEVQMEYAIRVEDIGDADYLDHVACSVDPRHRPQLYIRVLRTNEGDVLVLNLSHAAGDATSIMGLSALLLKEYFCLEHVPPPSCEMPERDTLWTRRFGGSLHNELPPAQMRTMDPMWALICPECDHATSMHRHVFGPDKVSRIVRAAHRHNGTINDVLMAAYFLTLSDATGEMGPKNVFMPVNLRKHWNDPNRLVSNQAANVQIILERREGQGIREILPQVIERTSRLKRGKIGIEEQIEFDLACDENGEKVDAMVNRMFAMRKVGLADIFISNPGPFDLPDVPGLHDAFVCYPRSYLPTLCFIASSFRGRLIVTMGYQRSHEGKEISGSLMDRFCENVEEIMD